VAIKMQFVRFSAWFKQGEPGSTTAGYSNNNLSKPLHYRVIASDASDR